MYKVSTSIQSNPCIAARHSNLGDLMKVSDVNHESIKDHILLNHYDGFTDLNNPSLTWKHDCTLNVIVLKPGESITLTVK